MVRQLCWCNDAKTDGMEHLCKSMLACKGVVTSVGCCGNTHHIFDTGASADMARSHG